MKTKNFMVKLRFNKHTGAFATTENAKNFEKVIEYLLNKGIPYTIENSRHNEVIYANIPMKFAKEIFESLDEQEGDLPTLLIHR